MAPKNHLLKLFHLFFQSSFEGPNSSQIIFHQLLRKKTKKFRCPYYLTKMATSLKTTQLTPPLFFPCAKKSHHFSTIKIQNKSPNGRRPRSWWELFVPKGLWFAWGRPAHRLETGGQRVLVDGYPPLGTNRSLKGLQVGYICYLMTTPLYNTTPFKKHCGTKGLYPKYPKLNWIRPRDNICGLEVRDLIFLWSSLLELGFSFSLEKHSAPL